MFLKSLVLVAVTSFSFFSTSSAEASMADGCFALYQPGSSNGVLCISGSHEEGIGGSNIRFLFYHAGRAVWCGRTAKLQVRWGKDFSSVVKYHFSSQSKINSIMMTWPARNVAKKEGRIRFNEGAKIDLLFMELSQETLRNLGIDKAFQSPVCQKGLALQ